MQYMNKQHGDKLMESLEEYIKSVNDCLESGRRLNTALEKINRNLEEQIKMKDEIIDNMQNIINIYEYKNKEQIL